MSFIIMGGGNRQNYLSFFEKGCFSSRGGTFFERGCFSSRGGRALTFFERGCFSSRGGTFDVQQG